MKQILSVGLMRVVSKCCVGAVQQRHFYYKAYYQISNPKHYIATNMSREKSQQLLRHIQLNWEPYCHNKFASNHYKELYD